MKHPLLTQYHKEADAYYADAEYHQLVKQLRKILESVRGKVIALDLEKVLITNNPYRYSCDPPLAIALKQTQKDDEIDWRLRRPLSSEILKILSGQNKVVICTAVTQGLADDLLNASEIERPESVTLITRKDLQQALDAAGMREDDKLFDLPGELQDDLRERVQRNLIHAAIKIPSQFNLDLLVDDKGRLHRRACELLGMQEDVEKILAVDPFEYSTKDQLMQLYRNRGIIDIAEQIRQRLAA